MTTRPITVPEAVTQLVELARTWRHAAGDEHDADRLIQAVDAYEAAAYAASTPDGPLVDQHAAAAPAEVGYWAYDNDDDRTGIGALYGDLDYAKAVTAEAYIVATNPAAGAHDAEVLAVRDRERATARWQRREANPAIWDLWIGSYPSEPSIAEWPLLYPTKVVTGAHA